MNTVEDTPIEILKRLKAERSVRELEKLISTATEAAKVLKNNGYRFLAGDIERSVRMVAGQEVAG